MNELQACCVDRESELLLNCARTHVDQAQAGHITFLVGQDLNWGRLLKLAQRNGLMPLLFFHLNRICPAAVPEIHLDFLRDYFQKNSAFNLLLTGELLRLLKSFEAGGIRAVAYKGPIPSRSRAPTFPCRPKTFC
jgi:hypothetical protein